jgi:hypothetical protein
MQALEFTETYLADFDDEDASADYAHLLIDVGRAGLRIGSGAAGRRDHAPACGRSD